jgi:regulator of cell morphogenesis and NO signaling
MTVMTERTIGEIAAETPAAIRIFERHGMDYCCGGGTALALACERAGITPEQFASELEASLSMPAKDLDWTIRTLTELHAYLVARFHVHGREVLETLRLLADKVLRVHGVRHPELVRVASLVNDLEQDMLPHMVKEEMILFPYVDQLENSDEPQGSCFGTVANPIRVMMMEHDAVGDILRDLREVTSGFAVPDDGCFSYRELYRLLAEFEAETHEHIHLENNVYFPRALGLESRVTS